MNWWYFSLQDVQQGFSSNDTIAGFFWNSVIILFLIEWLYHFIKFPPTIFAGCLLQIVRTYSNTVVANFQAVSQGELDYDFDF
jgi:hypothetical protein